MTSPINLKEWEIFACFPLIALPNSIEEIQFGPVTFWNSTRGENFIPTNLLPVFKSFLAGIEKICMDQKKVKADILCASVSKSIPEDKRDSALINALYMLYFAATFKSLYYNHADTHFSLFKKIIPLTLKHLNQNPLEHLDSLMISHHPVFQIESLDVELCRALGLALESVYLNSLKAESIKSIVRSLRFFIDRFDQKFENLLSYNGEQWNQHINDPEDILLLAASFESLLDIDEKFASQSMKQKLRPMLNLKFSKPVEIFWKWVDGFYALKRKIIRGEESMEDIFKDNENFEVPYAYLGIKLFIYTFYYQLFSQELITSTEAKPAIPPDFNSIHPQELLLFLWPEQNILRKTSILLMELGSAPNNKECSEDLNLMSRLFTSLFSDYFRNTTKKKHLPVKFIPSQKNLLEMYAKAIFDTSDKYVMIEGRNRSASDFIIPDFLPSLRERLK